MLKDRRSGHKKHNLKKPAGWSFLLKLYTITDLMNKIVTT